MSGESPDYTCDVAIVGFGGAGAAAAITAADAGASVLIIEKMPEAGGSTRESGGTIRQIADEAAAIEHIRALTEGRTPDAVIQAFVQGVTQVPDWLRKFGAKLELAPSTLSKTFPRVYPESAFGNLAGAEGIGGKYRVVSDDVGARYGESLFTVLFEEVLARPGIQIIYNARANRLLTSDSKTETEVIGVAFERDGKSETIAARSVLLTCGGYNFDTEMQREFLGVALPAMSPPGGNTGDGTRMAQEVGADLWHMNAVAAKFGWRLPGYDAAFHARMPTDGFVIVDQDGQRYCDEMAVEAHASLTAMIERNVRTGMRRRLPSFVIFDEKTMQSGQLTRFNTGFNHDLQWGEPNAVMREKGYFPAYDSIAEVAVGLGLSESALCATVEQFNGIARGQGSDALGRSSKEMLPLENPPYYGREIWPVLLNTQGGPRRDEQGRVINVRGLPIQGLFSAGELGSMWSSLYPGAGNVSEALVFGRIIGANAATRALAK